MHSQEQNLLKHLGIPRSLDYQPFYCEENIYRLAAELAAGSHHVDFSALFISNRQQTCALLHQRAAPAGEIVLWDYHVVLLLSSGTAGRHCIVDLDSRLGAVTPAETYLRATFGLQVAPSLRPRFRQVGGAEFLDSFSTDRRHMREQEQWLQPPPPWEPPCGAHAGSCHELPRFLDTSGGGPGQVLTLPELAEELPVTSPQREPDRVQRR